ncbi:hypothetical protein [Flavobacterium sp. ZS1P14]|uniref:hypothetical protein n=1 Tax=Flavobacterium sp. ZS1P14 TaxID=3401729 RepID=UPI003AAEA865
MLNETIIENSKKLFQLYIPNLLSLLTGNEFLNFIEKSYTFTVLNDGKTANRNFLVTFLLLVEEVAKNESQEIRNELGYFNFLLGEFAKIEKNKEFKNLVLSVVNNFEQNDFKNVLGEIAVCLVLSNNAELLKYESVQQNNKSIDFEFKDADGNTFLVEVLNIEYNSAKYEKGNPFEKFICGRLETKFNEKSMDLSVPDKNRILIFPIIHGFSIEIVRENILYLTTINKKRFPKDGFNSFNPMSFAKVQGTYFSLFTMEEIAVGELKRNNNGI